MTVCDFAEGRRRKEPACEGIFTHAGAGLGEKLKEASRSEEVEIRCVEAWNGIGAHGLGAIAFPAVLDAGQPLTVEIDGPFGESFFAEDFRMVNGYRDEDCERNEQPPCEERISIERPPDNSQSHDDEQETQISKRAMHLFKVGDSGFTGLLALTVLFRWR